MKYSSLQGYARLTILIIVLIVFGCFIYLSHGEKMNQKLAGTICAKLIYDYVDKNFLITQAKFNYSYQFNISRVDLQIKYPNGRKYSSSCFYKNKYSNSTIFLKKATLIDSKGKIVIFDNLKIDYEQ